MEDITASVGEGGENRRADVLVVQRLLHARGFRCGGADGICGPRTRAAIVAFQRGCMRFPDGRVDPGGTTIRELNGPDGESREADALTRLVPLPPANTFNIGLHAPNNALMTELFGEPRGAYSADCQPVTQVALRERLRTANVGPFQATGLDPALASLREVMADIQREQPQVYRLLGTAGMLCCRLVRGSATSISNHSWGTAIDLTLNHVLDARGNGMVQYGLTLIAPIFNHHGWYWGAGFSTEDAMHFEASEELVRRWKTVA